MNQESIRHKVRGPSIIHEIIEGEVVIINLDTGTYYSIDNAGGRIWEGVEAGASVGEIAEDLQNRYDAGRAEINQFVRQVLDDLKGYDLIIPADGAVERPIISGSTAEVDGNGKKPKLEPCKIGVYKDIEELLVLDPIHDVSEAGWPKKK